jgi:hypothetical protein
MGPLEAVLSQDCKHILCGNLQCRPRSKNEPLGIVRRMFDGEFEIWLREGYQLHLEKKIYLWKGRKHVRSRRAYKLREHARKYDTTAHPVREVLAKEGDPQQKAELTDLAEEMAQGLREQAKKGPYGTGGLNTVRISEMDLKDKPVVVCCSRCSRSNILRYTVVQSLRGVIRED